MLLDCRSLEIELTAFPAEASVLILDSGTRRALADGGYNERRASCERALEIVQGVDNSVRALRDVDEPVLRRSESEMDAITFRCAQHVVQECARPRRFAEALKHGDLEAAGQLMNESHESLRDLYEVSTAELDQLTEQARRHPACWGARLTGAGFGGSAVALVESGRVDDFHERLQRYI